MQESGWSGPSVTTSLGQLSGPGNPVYIQPLLVQLTRPQSAATYTTVKTQLEETQTQDHLWRDGG